MSPPQIARGPEAPHFETTRAADETATEECTSQIVSATLRRRIVRVPDHYFGGRSGRTRRLWREARR